MAAFAASSDNLFCHLNPKLTPNNSNLSNKGSINNIKYKIKTRLSPLKSEKKVKLVHSGYLLIT